MRLAPIALLASALAAPAMAADVGTENLFGRDPGAAPAYACFTKSFDAAWLQAHPTQNIERLTVFVHRRVVEGTAWDSSNLEVRFRDSAATYHVTAECSSEGRVRGCGVDCEGGGFEMTAISKTGLGITVDGYLRYYDTSDSPTDASTRGFQPGDRGVVAERTALRDCLPLIADEEIKAKVADGALTQ